MFADFHQCDARIEPVLNDVSLFPRKSATLMEYIKD